MGFLMVGSHPAVDFLNTTYTPKGSVVETLGDGNAFLLWLVESSLLDGEAAAKVRRRFPREALDAAAAEARAFREWARDWLARWRRAPRGDYRRELAALNRQLGRLRIQREVVTEKDGVRLVDRPQVGDPDALVGLVAAQVAELFAGEDAALLKECAGSGCSLWFLDRTKAHRRVFCSAAACGNRAKVSAFRERQRQQA